MIDVSNIIDVMKGLWDKIPPRWRDWSKSEIRNFAIKKLPDFFKFCRDKISSFWGKVPNSRVKTTVDKITSKFFALNDKIPADIKKHFFEQITGSQYNPESDSNTEVLAEVVQTDDEKKAAAMQMAYLIAVLGEMNQKQEVMLEEYISALKITEKLKFEIIEEMEEAEKEFAKFAEELKHLDKEFERTSAETATSKKEANDIIDLI
jgi:thioredoxin-like negative regulator of GroEL